MYRTCLFCSADLGENDALEEFPVGRSLAFDGERGRLRTVCRRCSRWNLAPIEERWEAPEGELWMLEAAWREAEEIAAIADALPDDPLDRIRSRNTEAER